MHRRPPRSLNTNEMNALNRDDKDLPPPMNPSFKSANMRFLSPVGSRGLSAVESLMQRSMQEPYINSEEVSLQSQYIDLGWTLNTLQFPDAKTLSITSKKRLSSSAISRKSLVAGSSKVGLSKQRSIMEPIMTLEDVGWYSQHIEDNWPSICLQFPIPPPAKGPRGRPTLIQTDSESLAANSSSQ